MKALSTFVLLLLFAMTACNNSKPDQTSISDSVTTASNSETDTLLAKIKAQAKPVQPVDTTIQTRIMRWQNVVVNENGTSYEFLDRDGNAISCIINMAGFDFYNNPYFVAKYAAQAQFPTITMKDGVNETWYHVTIKKETGQDEEGVKSTYNVVTAIEPLNK